MFKARVEMFFTNLKIDRSPTLIKKKKRRYANSYHIVVMIWKLDKKLTLKKTLYDIVKFGY